MTKMKVPQMTIEQIYKQFKDDLLLCIKYHRKGQPEMVKEYFWTDKWEEIEKQIAVICSAFTDVQKIQLSVVTEQLHNFYILSDNQWTTSEKKLKPKSNGLNGTTTQEL